MTCECDVCRRRRKVTVAASTMGPVSFAYCDECLANHREPYDVMVAYISCAGHFPEEINPTYQKLVRHNLELAHIPEEQFIEDVNAEINDMNMDFGE